MLKLHEDDNRPGLPDTSFEQNPEPPTEPEDIPQPTVPNDGVAVSRLIRPHRHNSAEVVGYEELRHFRQAPDDREFMAYRNRNTAHRLGRFIAEQKPHCVTMKDDFRRQQVTYTASLYAFTEQELMTVLEEVYRMGKKKGQENA